MSVVRDGYDDVRGNDRLTGWPHQLELEHTTVTFEYGPVGVIARVDYHTRPVVRYAGPLPRGTISALAEVARE